MDKKVAIYIILAQMFSDFGKKYKLDDSNIEFWKENKICGASMYASVFDKDLGDKYYLSRDNYIFKTKNSETTNFFYKEYKKISHYYFINLKEYYKHKDEYILFAIKRIIAGGGDGFKFSVIRDTSGIANYIVYFNFKLNGKNKQISFHSFSSKLKVYLKGSTQTSWRKSSSSRENAKALLEAITLG